jgi:hypothetical protein
MVMVLTVAMLCTSCPVAAPTALAAGPSPQKVVETVGKFTCMLLVPPAVIEGYLSQSAHGMAENAEVNEYAFFFHLGVNWK